MAVAMAHPETEKGGRGKKNPLILKEFNAGLLSQARLVLRVIPLVALSVIAGEKPLAEAYEEAKVMEADRKEGELAKGTRGTARGRNSSGGSKVVPPEKDKPTLTDQGIDNHLADRARGAPARRGHGR